MNHELQVVIPEELKAEVPPEKRAGLIGLLKQDIRPGYLHAHPADPVLFITCRMKNFFSILIKFYNDRFIQ
jgi:hypothetical protein